MLFTALVLLHLQTGDARGSRMLCALYSKQAHLMSPLDHSPVGTSCPRVGIGVTRPHRCLLLSFFVVFLGGESGARGV
jgi:hypothetical protein